jgi:GT2 family glycosyltransferase
MEIFYQRFLERVGKTSGGSCFPKWPEDFILGCHIDVICRFNAREDRRGRPAEREGLPGYRALKNCLNKCELMKTDMAVNLQHPNNDTPGCMGPLCSRDVTASVAAVVLNWNGCERVLEAISALYKSEFPLAQIFMVDNGSTDGSVETVQKNFPLVTILSQRSNLGVSEGRNVGIRQAIASGVDYIFHIDNDIEVTPETIGELVRLAEKRPDVGIVGTIMYFKSDPTLIQNIGGRICYRQHVLLPVAWMERDRGQYTSPVEVEMVAGGAMLTRCEVFRQVGYFDGGYLGYGLEDTDFCVRVRHAGWKLLCNPRAKAFHNFHVTHKYNYRRKYLESRNAVLFLRKYGRLIDWAKYLFFALAGLPYAFIREASRGNLGGVYGKAQGLFDALIRRDERAMRVFLSSD